MDSISFDRTLSTYALIATGVFKDLSTDVITSSVTWSLSSNAIGTINANTGVVTPNHSVGIVTVTATLGTISGSRLLSATDPH
jgi:hypothetical protein